MLDPVKGHSLISIMSLGYHNIHTTKHMKIEKLTDENALKQEYSFRTRFNPLLWERLTSLVVESHSHPLCPKLGLT